MPTLSKNDGANDLSGITTLGLGLSWDTTGGASKGLMGKLKRKKGVDLDAIGILFTGDDPVRYVGLDVTNPLSDGTVTSTGDNTTGAGDGDDELILLQLDKIPHFITKVVVVIAAFKVGTDFEKAANISAKVYDRTGGSSAQVADIWPSLIGTGNAIAIAKADRTPTGAWTLTVLNERGQITPGDIKSLLRFAANK